MINKVTQNNKGYSHGGSFTQRPHLVVELKKTWYFDTVRRLFLSTSGKSLSPMADLPGRSRIVYMDPHLAKQSLDGLSIEDRDFARYLYIIFPKDTNPNDYLEIVNLWECVKDVELPPEISLPGK